VLIDHPLIVLGGDGGQSLWQQEITGVSGANLHNFPLLAQ
jgi:hypothetical protein